MARRLQLLLVVLCGALFIGVGQPIPAFAGSEEEAARQLELAETDLEAGRAEQAAAAAASALRLDPGLHGALVVKALAYRAMDRADEARSLLRAYLDLRDHRVAGRRDHLGMRNRRLRKEVDAMKGPRRS